MDKIKRGDILWIDLGQNPKTHLQSGCRPCIVVSSNKANQSSKTFNVIPGTTKQKKDNFPVHLKIFPKDINGFLGKTTTFLIESICTIDEKQILYKAGHIKETSSIISTINNMLIRQLELEL